MKKYFIGVFFIAQIFGFGGVGVYALSDMVSRTPAITTDANNLLTITPGDISNHLGGGGFLYLDVLPFIDLELSGEVAAVKYPIAVNVAAGEFTQDIAATRGSAYLTLRKKIIGASVPLLAKIQLYAGLGANKHWVTPDFGVPFVESTFSNIESVDFSDTQVYEKVLTKMKDNKIESDGFHVQIGMQAKLLTFNMFINGRYTIAPDVIGLGSSGFPSAWVGLALGF